MHDRYATTSVVVLSGGLDSSVLLYQTVKDAKRVRAVYFDFGKPVSPNEISSAKSICLKLGVPLDVVDVSGLTRMQLGYIPAEHVRRDEADTKGSDAPTDSTYVSGFHILLSMSSYYAQIVGAPQVLLGLILEQFKQASRLKEVVQSCAHMVSTLNPALGAFEINAHFANMSKAEVIRLGDRLGTPLEETWSCLEGDVVQCGECAQCRDRRAAFAEAGVEDKTPYRT